MAGWRDGAMENVKFQNLVLEMAKMMRFSKD